jgi:amino acid transporter
MTGWLCFTGWQSAITGIGFLVATIIEGLAILNNPSYVPQRWHSTLLVIAVVAFCVIFNTFFARKLPLIEGTLAILHFGGLFVIIIILWTLSPRNNAHDAFLQLNNDGGWSTDGLSMLVGLYPLTLCLIGFDSQVHMGEFPKSFRIASHQQMPRYPY